MDNNKIFKLNFYAFIWHAFFLALASNFMNMDTIIPAMLLRAGGSSVELGLLTAIMIGFSTLFQLLFAGFLAAQAKKKKYLLIGIHLRVFSLLALALLFLYSDRLSNQVIIFNIFLFISVFAFSGAFANISYTDILGKAVLPTDRKKFFTVKQSIGSVGILLSSIGIKLVLQHYNYPINYSILFFFATGLLGIATVGFWVLIEPATKLVKGNFKLLKYLKRIPKYIRDDKNLLYYLIIINILAFALTIIPFLIDFAKSRFKLTGNVVGNFIILRTIGMLVASLILMKFSKHRKYKGILKFTALVGALIPVVAIFFIRYYNLYLFIFFLSGIFFAVYQIAVSGILLEISKEHNRAIYTGIAGFGSIIGIIFPSVAGGVVTKYGHSVVFIFVSIVVLSSFIFINKLKC